MGVENYADYHAAIHDPETVHGMIEDYRAGLGIDRTHDEADRRAGRTLACPVLCVWALQDDLEDLYGDVLSVWRPWAPILSGLPIDCGHHMAEEAPEELARALTVFISPKALSF
jgi:haloacetate dehalogenase